MHVHVSHAGDALTYRVKPPGFALLYASHSNSAAISMPDDGGRQMHALQL